MKKFILFFALMVSVSSSFISCRDEAEKTEDSIEDVGDDLEDAGEDIEDEIDDND